MGKREELNNKIRALIELSNNAQRKKDEVLSLVNALTNELGSGKISRREYYDKLGDALKLKSPEDWIKYYDNYIADCKLKIIQCRQLIEEEESFGKKENFGKVLQFLVFIVFIAVIISLIYNFGPALYDSFKSIEIGDKSSGEISEISGEFYEYKPLSIISKNPNADFNESTKQGFAVVGKNVKWKSEIEMISLEEFSVNIPKGAKIISIKDKAGNAIESVKNLEGGKDYSVEFETIAPKISKEIVKKDKERVVVSSPVHYQNVYSAVKISEKFKLKKSEKRKLKLYQIINENGNEKKIPVDIYLYDTNEDKIIDKAEWVTSYLSEAVFEFVIINITKAEHLDAKRDFISDIYEDVRTKDGIWSEAIKRYEYVRVTFEKNLTNKNDITIYAKSAKRKGNSQIEVYRKGESEAITKFENVTNENWYKVYLTNLSDGESLDVFDLKVIGMVEIDYVVDPAGTAITDCNSLANIDGTGSYYLTKDIECMGVGFISRPCLSGTFDGDGFIIRDLIINTAGPPGNDGLFQCLNNGATIKNLVLENVRVECRDGGVSCGALAGYVSSGTGYISYSSVIGNITNRLIGIENIGGLAGYGNLVIDNSYAYVNVSSVCPTSIGGLVGKLTGSTITNSYFNGTVKAGCSGYFSSTTTGGLIGNSLSGTVIKNSYSAGGVYGISALTAELIGSNSGTLTNVYFYDYPGDSGSNCAGGGSSTGCTLITNVADFYSKTQNVYDGNLPYWDFENFWKENTGALPTFFTKYNVGVSICSELNQKNTVYTLTQDVVQTIDEDCFNITKERVTLDCNGYSITGSFNRAGVRSNSTYTIIKNCNIHMGTSTGGVGIALFRANYSQILNNNLGTKGCLSSSCGDAVCSESLDVFDAIYSNVTGGINSYLLNQQKTYSSCNINDYLLSGAGESPSCDSGNPVCGRYIYLERNEPLNIGGREGWRVQIDAGGDNIYDTVRTEVICMNNTKVFASKYFSVYYAVNGTNPDDYSLGQDHTRAYCDLGDKVIGGGGFASYCSNSSTLSCNKYQSIEYNEPTVDVDGREGWYTSIDVTPGQTPDTVQTFAICLKKTAYFDKQFEIYQVSNVASNRINLDQNKSVVYCNPGDKVLGGGGAGPNCTSGIEPACTNHAYLEANRKVISGNSEGLKVIFDLDYDSIPDTISTYAICLKIKDTSCQRICADNDADGYDGCIPGRGGDAFQRDCDDSKFAVKPGAAEVCNGIDDNCDGNVDEGIAGCAGQNIGLSMQQVGFSNITRNYMSYNKFRGLYSKDGFFNIITDNEANNNTETGFYINGGANNSLMNNIALTNRNDGFRIVGTRNNTLKGNIAINNSNGIYLEANNTIISENYLINNSGAIASTGGNGIYLFKSKNNFIFKNTVKNNSQSGIYLLSDSNNNTIKNLFSTLNRYGIFIDGSNNTIVRDSNISENSNRDVFLSKSTNITFVNSSYNILKEVLVLYSNLTRKWYYRAYVNDSKGNAINNMNVSAYNASKVMEFGGLMTDSYGWTEITEITDYVILGGASGGVRNYYSNYTINATNGTLTGEHTFNSTLGNNLEDWFNFDFYYPYLNFTYPTPENYSIKSGFVEINISIEEDNLKDFVFNWNGTNFTIYNGSLVLMMNFDNRSELGESSGFDFAYDASLYANHGTCIGMDIGCNWTSGRYDGGINFDGVDDYVSIPDSNSLNFDNAITVSLWIKAGKLVNYDGGLVSKSVDGSKYFGSCTTQTSLDLGILDNVLYWELCDSYVNSGTVANSAVQIIDENWHHITGTWEKGSYAKLYYDGVLVKTSSNILNTPLVSFNSFLDIGGYTTPFNFNGTIDEVRIYNRSLDSGEVYELYASNLQKYNPSQWYFYVNQSKSAISMLDEGNYTYSANATDLGNLKNQTETRIIRILPNSVSECMVLDKPNTIYYSIRNISSPTARYCINISAENITFDCHGFNVSNTNFAGGVIWSNSTNTTIKNCDIRTMGGAGAGTGLYLATNASKSYLFNLTFNGGSGINIHSNESVFELINIPSYSINSISISGSNNLFKDCVFPGGFFYSGTGILNNTLLNCTYPDEYASNEYVTAGSTLIRQWYYRAYVKYVSETPANNADVTAYNKSTQFQFTTKTDATGFTNIMPITDYVTVGGASGGVKNYYSNYSIYATDGTLADYHTFNASLGNNLMDIFVLREAEPPEIVAISDLDYWTTEALVDANSPTARNLLQDDSAAKNFEFYVWSSGGVAALPNPVVGTNAIMTVRTLAGVTPAVIRRSSDGGKAVACTYNRDATCIGAHTLDTCRVYRCAVAMWYYDNWGGTPGNWNVTAYIKDNLGKEQGDKSDGTYQGLIGLPVRRTYFNKLQASTIVPAAGTLDFGTISQYGAQTTQPTDVAGTYPLVIRNIGNADITDVRLKAMNIPGVTRPAELILASWFKSASVNPCTGTALVHNTLIPSTGTLVPQIDNGLGAQGNLRVCLTDLQVSATAQDYLANGVNQWVVDTNFVHILSFIKFIKFNLGISIFSAAFALKRKRRKKKGLNNELLKALEENKQEIINYLNAEIKKIKKEIIPQENKQLLGKAGKIEEKQEIRFYVPVGIFKNKPGSAGALVKYLHENENLKFFEIAKLINRDQRTVWVNYNRNPLKKKKLETSKEGIQIPVQVFSDRRLSIFESLIKYLREKGYKNSEIAEILNKDQRNIGTFYSRALRKMIE